MVLGVNALLVLSIEPSIQCVLQPAPFSHTKTCATAPDSIEARGNVSGVSMRCAGHCDLPEWSKPAGHASCFGKKSQSEMRLQCRRSTLLNTKACAVEPPPTPWYEHQRRPTAQRVLPEST